MHNLIADIEKKREHRIKLEACEHRKLYRLLARNLRIGVWDGGRQEFVGIRTKFGRRFLDSENHWDAEEFATASPLEVLGELPTEIPFEFPHRGDPGDSTLFAWLEAKELEFP